MKELSFERMQNVEGGSIGCAASLTGLGISLILAASIATPIGAAVFAAAFIVDSVGVGLSCG